MKTTKIVFETILCMIAAISIPFLVSLFADYAPYWLRVVISILAFVALFGYCLAMVIKWNEPKQEFIDEYAIGCDITLMEVCDWLMINADKYVSIEKGNPILYKRYLTSDLKHYIKTKKSNNKNDAKSIN